jgi:predicted dehydrogenase
MQVDGTQGSAVATLRDCVVQPHAMTPRPIWNPDIDNPIRFRDTWADVPTYVSYDNAFKAQWELFLRHIVKDEPFPWDLREGAKGVQLAEKGLEAWRERRTVELPELEVRES